MMKNIINKTMVEEMIEEAYMPMTSSDFYKQFRARSRVDKDNVRKILEELDEEGVIQYRSITGMKEKIVFPYLKKKLPVDIRFKGHLFNRNDSETNVFVGYSDLETIGKVSRVVGFRGNSEGFQRMKQRSWVLELSRVFSLKDTFLFTSIVLFIPRSEVNYNDKTNELQLINGGKVKYEEEKPALIVDGQQRCYAFHELKIGVEKSTPEKLNTPLVIIIGKPKDLKLVEFLKVLFINANKSKPLPKSLIDQLLATMEDLDDKTIVDSSKKGGRYSKIVKIADERPSSPIYGKVAFDYKANARDLPFRFSIASYQVKFLENHLLTFVNDDQLDDTILTEVYLDIYSSIKDIYSEIFDSILSDARSIGPLFIFLAKMISTEIIYQPNRRSKFTNALETIKDYIGLVPIEGKSRKWSENEGEWNPEKLEGRSRIEIEKAANQLLNIYISVIRS